jgi:hypothetical protein
MSRVALDGDAEGGAPVVLSQALACGVPVVSTRHCDIPWIVEHERSGFIVESGDVEGAAAHLARVLDDPSLCRALSRAGRDTARRRMSAAVCGQLLERIYLDATALGPVSRIDRGEPLHPGLVSGIVLDLRRRGGDVDGLVRLGARARLGRDLQGRAHRAAGELYEQRGDAAAAGSAYQRWRRLMPDDPHAALHEARAWLRSDTPEKAVAPLAAFVSAHADLSYALNVAMAELEAQPAGRALARLLIDRARTPADRLGVELQVIERRSGAEAPATNRRRLRQALARFRRTWESTRRVSETARSEAALVMAYVLALRLGDGESAAALRWLCEPGRVREPLLRYRLASALAAQGGASTDWAQRAFLHLGRNRALPLDVRAGAWFHLAGVARRMGRAEDACRALDRCLALVPDHEAAIRLRETLSNAPRSARED